MSPRITCGDNNTIKQVLSSSWDGRPFGYNRHGPKIGSCAPFGGEAGFHVTQCGLGRGLPSYQVAPDPSSRFVTHTDGPKFNGLCPLGGKAVARVEAYHRTKWHLDPSIRLATTNIGQKWGLCPLFRKGESLSPSPKRGYSPKRGRGTGSPSSTMWPGQRPTSIPSGILIHPTVWAL